MARHAEVNPGRCLRCLIWVVFAALGLGGCGGSSSGPTVNPTPAPTPTPRPPEVVLEFSGFEAEVEFAYGWYFDISGSGSIDATIDYTFADSILAIWIASGQCTEEQFPDLCTYVAQSFGGPDPRVVSASGQPAGTYTLVIANAGPHTETLSSQVVFSQQLGATSRPAADGRAPGSLSWSAPVQSDRVH